MASSSFKTQSINMLKPFMTDKNSFKIPEPFNIKSNESNTAIKR